MSDWPVSSFNDSASGAQQVRSAYGGLDGLLKAGDTGSAPIQMQRGAKGADSDSTDGVSGEISASTELVTGIKLPDTELRGKVAAKASAQGNASAGVDSDGVSASASGKVGAEVTADAHASGKLGGDAGVSGSADAHAKGGASASAETELSLKLDNITASAEASAMAGVTADARGSGSFDYKGRKLFAVSGGVEASAGAGGKISGTFSFKDGVLKVGGGLGATLGIGGGVDVGVEVDFVGIGRALKDLVTFNW